MKIGVWSGHRRECEAQLDDRQNRKIVKSLGLGLNAERAGASAPTAESHCPSTQLHPLNICSRPFDWGMLAITLLLIISVGRSRDAHHMRRSN